MLLQFILDKMSRALATLLEASSLICDEFNTFFLQLKGSHKAAGAHPSFSDNTKLQIGDLDPKLQSERISRAFAARWHKGDTVLDRF